MRLDPECVGEAILTLGTANGRWVRVHSRRDPAAEADRQIAAAFESAEPDLVVVIGLGMGYVLDAVERRSSRTRVLALEPVPASLPHMLARRDWSAWLTNSRLRLLVGPAYSGASDAWKDFDAEASMPPIVVHPVLNHAAGAEVARAREVVERIAFGVRSNLNARKRFALRYLLNTLKNLPVISREGDVGGLFDAFEAVPAIVISAGPSLDRNIPQLRAFPDRAVLIAADTALRPLLGAGIHPHLVVGLDPSEINSRHLANLPNPGRTWLVAEGSMGPVVFEQFEGRTFIFNVSDHHPWPWLRRMGLERRTLLAWGSVATSAFDLAVKMGCDPIVFAGQDLAYTGGQPYCRGTTFEADWANEVAAGVELPDIWSRVLAQSTARAVPDIAGHDVVTMPQLVAFRDWFVEQTGRLGRRTVSNATGGGILQGPRIRQVDLSSVLASLPIRPALHTRVHESWRRTAREESEKNPQWLDGLTGAARGEELEAWASFASVTPGALTAELDGIAVALNGEVTHVAGDGPVTNATFASPSIDPAPEAVVYPPERVRACRASLLDEEVPDWARGSAGHIYSFDTPAFQKAFGGLQPSLLVRTAERCESAGAFAHAVALYRAAADRLRRDDPESARAAAISWLRCLFWAGELEAAQSLFALEPMLQPPDLFAVGCLSAIYQFVLVDDTAAVSKIEGLVATFPDMPDLRLNLAVRLAMRGNLQDARDLVDIDATRWPGRVQTEYVRGVCLRFQTDYKEATRILTNVVGAWPYAAPELVIASIGTGQQPAIERALRTVRESFRSPVVFVNALSGQSSLVDDALTRIGAALATKQFLFDVSRVSAITTRLVTRAANAWTPSWQL